MNALGHASKAVHRASAEAGDAEIPSLEEYEMTPEEKAKIIRMPSQTADGDSATMTAVLAMLASNPVLAETVVRLGLALAPHASATS